MAFYISKVTAIGSGKTPASVEFNSGLILYVEYLTQEKPVS